MLHYSSASPNVAGLIKEGNGDGRHIHRLPFLLAEAQQVVTQSLSKLLSRLKEAAAGS